MGDSFNWFLISGDFPAKTRLLTRVLMILGIACHGIMDFPDGPSQIHMWHYATLPNHIMVFIYTHILAHRIIVCKNEVSPSRYSFQY